MKLLLPRSRINFHSYLFSFCFPRISSSHYVSVYSSPKPLVQYSLPGSPSVKPEWYSLGLISNSNLAWTTLWCGDTSKVWIAPVDYSKQSTITNIVVTKFAVSLKPHVHGMDVALTKRHNRCTRNEPASGHS